MLASHIMTAAGFLALISSVGMGILTSETLQVTLYGSGLKVRDSLYSRIPLWLSTSDPGADTPIEFLTDGPVVEAILQATLSAAELEARAIPRIELVKSMESAAQTLKILQQNLRMALATAWQSLEGTRWRKKYVARLQEAISNLEATPASFWFGLKEEDPALPQLRANLTRFTAAELDDVLYAYGCNVLKREVEFLVASFYRSIERGDIGVVLSMDQAHTHITMTPVEPSLRAEFIRVETRLAATNRTGTIVRVLEYKLKEKYIVEPRLKAVRAAIQQEKALASYTEFQAWEQARGAQVLRAGAHLQHDPAAAAAFESFLTNLQSWGFDFPDDISRKVPGPRRLTRRDLERRLAIERFRVAPNRWVTLFIVSVFLGGLGFLIGVVYSLAFIINMGILGTARNCMAILYVRSEGALRRAQIEESQRTLALRDLSPTLHLQDRDVCHTD